MRFRITLVGAIQALGIAASATVVPVSPTDGAKVALVPDAQGLPRVRHHWWTKSGGVTIGRNSGTVPIGQVGC